MAEEEKRIVWSTKLVEETTQKLEDGYLLKGYEIPFFDKTPGLRRANIAFSASKEEWGEYLKCKEDIRYFIENFCYIKSEDGDYHIMSLRDYQHDIIELYNENKLSILCSARQVGKCFVYNTPLVIYNKKFKVYKEMKFFQFIFKTKKNKTMYDYFKHIIYTIINILD